MTGNQIAYWRYAEDVRHNAETESQGRTGLAETKRHNLVSEGLSARQINLGYAQLAETKRANIAREVLGTSELSEKIRSNMARETETNRANVAKEDEAYRHNTSMEMQENNRLNSEMLMRQRELDWSKYYATKIETPIKIGQALLGFAGNGLKLIAPGLR